MAVSSDRRRLTVSACDAPGGRRGRPEDLENLLASYKVDLFASLEAGKKGILLAARTDHDSNRRKSFSEKDTEVVVPEGQSVDENEAWLTSTLGIGYACRKGLKPESPNQDSFFTLALEGQYVLFCVLDGHGPYGHDISNIARSLLLKNLLSLDFRTDIEAAFKKCFLTTQVDIEQQKAHDCASSGTTCTMGFYDFLADTLTIAHVGDSRAVLGFGNADLQLRDFNELTIDHKPNDPLEKKRIEESDPPGRVEFDGYYNHRVFAQGKSYPGLNMSRALGDVIAHKEAGLTAMPDIKTLELKDFRVRYEKLVFLVCTDGVWEFMKESQEALGILLTSFEGEMKKAAGGSSMFSRAKADDSKPKELVSAGALAKESWDRWMNDSDNEISDDITVVWTML